MSGQLLSPFAVWLQPNFEKLSGGSTAFVSTKMLEAYCRQSSVRGMRKEIAAGVVLH